MTCHAIPVLSPYMQSLSKFLYLSHNSSLTVLSFYIADRRQDEDVRATSATKRFVLPLPLLFCVCATYMYIHVYTCTQLTLLMCLCSSPTSKTKNKQPSKHPHANHTHSITERSPYAVSTQTNVLGTKISHTNPHIIIHSICTCTCTHVRT